MDRFRRILEDLEKETNTLKEEIERLREEVEHWKLTSYEWQKCSNEYCNQYRKQLGEIHALRQQIGEKEEG